MSQRLGDWQRLSQGSVALLAEGWAPAGVQGRVTFHAMAIQQTVHEIEQADGQDHFVQFGLAPTGGENGTSIALRHARRLQRELARIVQQGPQLLVDRRTVNVAEELLNQLGHDAKGLDSLSVHTEAVLTGIQP